MRPLSFATTALVLCVLFLALYFALAAWRGREAEAAGNLSPRAAWLLAALALLPWAAGVLYAHRLADFLDRDASKALQALVVGAVMTVGAALVLPLLAASTSKEARARALPTLAREPSASAPAPHGADGAEASLCFNLVVARERQSWVRYWRREGHSEMAVIRHALGRGLGSPHRGTGAWRAEYPPNVTGK